MAPLTPRSRPPCRSPTVDDETSDDETSDDETSLSEEDSNASPAREVTSPQDVPDDSLRKFLAFLEAEDLEGGLAAAREAQAAAGDDPEAHRVASACVAWALFQLKRYGEAGAAAGRSLEASGWSAVEAEELLALRRACRTVPALAVSRSAAKNSPSQQLRGGWYAERLRSLIAEGKLDPPAGGRSDCSVLGSGPTRHVDIDRWATEGARDVNFHFDGGERDIPKGAFYPFPCTQGTGGIMHTKDRVWHLSCGKAECYSGSGPCSRCTGRMPSPAYAFPKWRLQRPADTRKPHPDLDVFVAKGLVKPCTHEMLRTYLDDIAARTRNRPAPKYENLIDPNVASVDGVWVPTDVVASSEPIAWPRHSRELVQACRRATGSALPSQLAARVASWAGVPSERGVSSFASAIPDLGPHRHHRLYSALGDVLTASLPLLAQLKRPALLLPGPLQVVVKAQRIVLAGEEEYAGVWHQDGLRESIVAVVLYYYRASSTLQGGALEFMARDSAARWTGDAGGPLFTPENTRTLIEGLPRCKVPVEEGTMVVFSNYSTVHRVLKILAEKGDGGSRDFVAFFVVDQRAPLATPDLGPIQERFQRRKEMLLEQLQPRGRFGADDSLVYSTGNGSVADIGWLSKYTMSRPPTTWGARDQGDLPLVESLNAVPPLGRGASYLLEGASPSLPWNPHADWAEHRIRGEIRPARGPRRSKKAAAAAAGSDAAGGRMEKTIFVWAETGEFRRELPAGVTHISGVVVFEDFQSWLAHGGGLWAEDADLMDWLEAP